MRPQLGNQHVRSLPAAVNDWWSRCVVRTTKPDTPEIASLKQKCFDHNRANRPTCPESANRLTRRVWTRWTLLQNGLNFASADGRAPNLLALPPTEISLSPKSWEMLRATPRSYSASQNKPSWKLTVCSVDSGGCLRFFTVTVRTQPERAWKRLGEKSEHFPERSTECRWVVVLENKISKCISR